MSDLTGRFVTGAAGGLGAFLLAATSAVAKEPDKKPIPLAPETSKVQKLTPAQANARLGYTQHSSLTEKQVAAREAAQSPIQGTDQPTMEEITAFMKKHKAAADAAHRGDLHKPVDQSFGGETDKATSEAIKREARLHSSHYRGPAPGGR